MDSKTLYLPILIWSVPTELLLLTLMTPNVEFFHNNQFSNSGYKLSVLHLASLLMLITQN